MGAGGVLEVRAVMREEHEGHAGGWAVCAGGGWFGWWGVRGATGWGYPSLFVA